MLKKTLHSFVKRIPYLALLLVVLASCESPTTEIVILSTNDMHAKIDNYAKVAAYVAKERKEHPNLLLLSAGDMFSGNPVVDQYSDKGFPIIEIMNRIGYSYTAIGNHDFDYDQELMAKRMAQAKFPWISANVHVSPQATIPQPEPYAKVVVDGVEIILLGLIEVSKSSKIPSTHPDKVKGITFTDPLKEAKNYTYLRNDCDVFIGLTHIGAEDDVKLAEQMPELDLIVGGHSHTRIDTGMVVNNVLITQTECWLKYIGKTTLTVKGGKVIARKNELINVKDLTEVDPEIAELINGYYASSGLDSVIAKNKTAITTKEALGCLMTDAITGTLGVDIAFQNSGGVRLNRLPKGDITKAQIFELDPFGNEVVTYSMTTTEIRELVYNASKSHRGAADLYVSGITYSLPKKGKATDVVLTTYKGKRLDDKKRYTVGMNSYISSSYKFTGSEKGKSTFITSADMLIDYLKKVKEVDYAKMKRTNGAEE